MDSPTKDYPKPSKEEKEILDILLAEIKDAGNINDRATAVSSYRAFDGNVQHKIKEKAFLIAQQKNNQ